MNAALEAEMKEAIGKHLPQAVGDVLQDRLKKADDDAVTVVRQKEQLDTLNGQLNTANAQLSAAKEELKKHDALTVREAAVAEKERNAEIAALKVQLEASQDNTKFAQELAMGLVRNTEYRRSVFDNEYRSEAIVPQGHTCQTGTANNSTNRNTTVDESAK